MKVLFIITVVKSKGEAYLTIKAAEEISKQGGECLFLAMPEVASFIRKHNVALIELTLKKEHNEKIVQKLIKNFKPNVCVYASYRNLHLGIGIGKVFDPQWLVQQKIPAVTYNPENFQASQNKIYAGPLINRTYRLEPIPSDMKVISTDFKENSVAPDNTYYYRINISSYSKNEERKKLKWSPDEKVIVFPISRWVYDNASFFNSSYYKEYLPNLLMYYFSKLKAQVRICVVGEKELFAGASWGNVVVEHRNTMTIFEYEKLVAAADVLLTDNGMSGSIEIATLTNTPVVVLKNTVAAKYRFGGLILQSPFSVKKFPEEIIKQMLTENNKSVFPFAVYPLGWWDIIENIYRDNPLNKTFCEAELFDENTIILLMNKVLWDETFYQQLRTLQKEYLIKQNALPNFYKILELCVGH